jgi:hypothetical protein
MLIAGTCTGQLPQEEGNLPVSKFEVCSLRLISDEEMVGLKEEPAAAVHVDHIDEDPDS